MAKTKQNGKKQESRALPQIKADAGRESLTPFSFVRSFMDEMDRLAGNFGLGRGLLSSTELDLPRGMWAPQVEMFERDGQLVVRADLPGMSKDEVKVQLDNNALTIEGERREEREENDGGFYRSERSDGKFYRRLPLPEGVNPDNARAEFHD